MPRIARIVVPNFPHHITQRGNRRQPVFFQEQDRYEYLRLIKKFSLVYGTKIWAYCLMDNHVHLIMVPNNEKTLTRTLQEAHRRYTRYINFREGWRGYLWQGRYASFPMDEKHLIAAIRYVERNPVEAKIVNRAEDYKWSSAKAHVYKTNDPILNDCYLTNKIKDWSRFLNNLSTNNKKGLIEKSIRTGRPLGSDEFIENLEKKLKRPLKRKKPGPKKSN